MSLWPGRWAERPARLIFARLNSVSFNFQVRLIFRGSDMHPMAQKAGRGCLSCCRTRCAQHTDGRDIHLSAAHGQRLA